MTSEVDRYRQNTVCIFGLMFMFSPCQHSLSSSFSVNRFAYLQDVSKLASLLLYFDVVLSFR